MDLETLAQQNDPDVIVGFFDLMGWLKWSEGRPPAEMLALAAGLMQRAGALVSGRGGLVIKAVGDAGLFIFPANDADKVLTAVRELKADVDAWLAAEGYPDALRVSLHAGPVACGPVGAPGREQLDIYGAVVNQAAVMKARPIAVSRPFAARLSDTARATLRPFGAAEFETD